MLYLSLQNRQRIRYFLSTHHQHEVKFTLQAAGDIDIHLGYHNGDCWMGDNVHDCEPGELNDALQELFRQAAKWRPDLFPEMP